MRVNELFKKEFKITKIDGIRISVLKELKKALMC